MKPGKITGSGPVDVGSNPTGAIVKALIVYMSVHHGNTEKVAQAIGEVLRAQLRKPDEVDPGEISEFDLVGFGSGVYFFRFHKSLLELIDKLPKAKGKKAFLFATMGGAGNERAFREVREKLVGKGFEVVGEFSCKGWDTVGVLRFFGGLNKGKPGEEDLGRARKFAEELREKI